MNLLKERDTIFSEVIRPFFKENGFKISGNTFQKKETDFIKIFNIQNSIMNFDNHITFYLNIGFFFPIEYEVSGIPQPKNPKEYDCRFRIRTNALTGKDQSYNLYSDTSIPEFRKQLEADLKTFVFPFFDRYKTLNDCLNLKKEFKDIYPNQEPYLALSLIKNGEVELGNKILDEYLEANQDEKEKFLGFKESLLQKR